MNDKEYFLHIKELLTQLRKPLLRKGKKPQVQQALNAFDKLLSETEDRLNKS